MALLSPEWKKLRPKRFLVSKADSQRKQRALEAALPTAVFQLWRLSIWLRYETTLCIGLRNETF